ncbi:MAG: folylpolyglutamate synthase/dihydrofolate synthase family protein, partial [Flavobacteriales bacterium]
MKPFKTYSQASSFLNNELPFYQLQGKTAFKPGLDNIKALCDHLDNPQDKIKTIHIAGTNGKGSTAHILASVLQEHGIKTGIHTSPHLLELKERLKIDGETCSSDFIIEFLNKTASIIERIKPSFFEVTVAMAFDHFAENETDIAIIETGLGGRLDATNIITPLIAAITNIGLEHQDFLGDSLEKIAYEKAGIMKQNVPAIIGENNPETREVFEKMAELRDSPLYFANSTNSDNETDLKGSYQRQNHDLTIKILDVLSKDLKLPLLKNFNDKKLKEGLKNVVKNTNIRGRWEIINNSPLTICDIA